MKKTYTRLILLSCFALFLSNCEGEDGTDGLTINGIDGIDGTDGINGTDGEDAFGFDELTQYGSITLTLEGTSPDDRPIDLTETFEFNSVEASDISGYNQVDYGTNTLIFNVKRFLSAPDDTYQDTNVYFDLIVTDPGEETESLDFDFGIEYYAVTFEDFDYFTIDEEYESDDTGVSNVVVTNYSFDDETNNLTFSFSLDVAADNNDTENDLSISGEVNVIVLEQIEQEDDGPGPGPGGP
ncbi:hypothetical protein [Aquimarina pacifica]|uniref:hypothetical protein n=1 Tax=Aquimarina pacifica TaxID=1296415 RepID=UPI000471E4C1|nr:hypothetical protein [Aquimarina pacifica]